MFNIVFVDFRLLVQYREQTSEKLSQVYTHLRF